MTDPKKVEAGRLGGLQRSEAKRRAQVVNCAKAREKKRLRRLGLTEEEAVKSGNNLAYPHKKTYRGRVVYLVSDGSGAFKIGSCTNPKERIRTLQIGNPRKIEFVGTWRFSNATLVEEELHGKFLNKRVRGEWFELTKADLKLVKSILHQLKHKELAMTKPIEIVIPATEMITDAYRLRQSERTMAEEKARPVEWGTNGLKSDLFKRGQPLAPEHCFLVEPIDGWDPAHIHPLEGLIPKSLKDRVDKEFSPEGIAGFIATSDTTAGVREEITYDENESIIKPIVEGEPHEEE